MGIKQDSYKLMFFQYVEEVEALKYLDGLVSHWIVNGRNYHTSIDDFAKSDKKQLFALASDTSK